MSTSLSDIEITMVDSEATLLLLLDLLTTLPTNPPSLYLDVEGINLSRHGSISLISILINPLKKIYLIDITLLGPPAFSTSPKHGPSLKAILESPDIPKIIFDIRAKSDALLNLFQISVDGVQDLQLMELAVREGSRRFVAGLSRCIRNAKAVVSKEMRREWQRAREEAARLFDPRQGGRYEVLNERPLRREIMSYLVRNVALLPVLYDVYDAKLSGSGGRFWRGLVADATKDRIRLAQLSFYDPRDRQHALGPWREGTVEYAITDGGGGDEDVVSEALLNDDGRGEESGDYDDEDWLYTDDLLLEDSSWEA